MTTTETQIATYTDRDGIERTIEITAPQIENETPEVTSQEKVLKGLKKIAKRILKCGENINYYGMVDYNLNKRQNWEEKLGEAYDLEEGLLNEANEETKDAYYAY